ncbi:MAG: hypothetical protein FJW26_03275 [Acidimicrobiia bacterium]|nr:hypothetical protein [Acidimicrobiia bacterium]
MLVNGKFRSHRFVDLTHKEIGRANLLPWVFFVLLAGCQQQDEFSDLQLQDFVYAYQNKGLFQKQESGWHGWKHAGAERGVRFFPFPDEPDKGVELYEFISIRERERSDRDMEAYARQRNLPYDPNSSLSIGRFSLYGQQQFSSHRQQEIVKVFRSVLERR